MTQIIFHKSGAGPPVLLLHAFPLNASMWDEQVRDWAEVTTCWAPDLPGFGASAGASIVTTLNGLAEALVERLAGEGISRAAVVGCSMGGYLAFALLRTIPEFVSALVLVNSKASADTGQAKANRLELARRVEREGCAFLAREWHLGALSPVTLERKPSVVERVQALVIHGLDDRYISETEAREMAKAIFGAEFLGVPQAAHLPNLESPRIVSEAVRRFLERGIGLGAA